MEEKKVKLNAIGFSFDQTQSGTYGLVLVEEGGVRRLLIVVGAPEAQSIAFKLQNADPPRPLTHDLFLSFMNGFQITLTEAFIYNYDNGIFYARLFFQQGEHIVTLESRSSDAVAIALRVGAPIYTTEAIMQELSVVFSPPQEEGINKTDHSQAGESTFSTEAYNLLSQEELEAKLDKAIQQENYELASIIRDELDKRSNTSNE